MKNKYKKIEKLIAREEEILNAVKEKIRKEGLETYEKYLDKLKDKKNIKW